LKTVVIFASLALSYILIINSWGNKNLLFGNWKAIDLELNIVFKPDNTYLLTLPNELEESGRFELSKSYIGVRFINFFGDKKAHCAYPNVTSNDYVLAVKELKQDSFKITFSQSSVTKPWSREIILFKDSN